MVNRQVDVQLTRQPRRSVAVFHPQLAARAVAIGVDGSLRHAELAGDLLGGKVLVDQPQAFALARCEQAHRIFDDDVACSHSAGS
ncbi:MAG TPA: hypothetical protein VNW53_18165 [Phenylobacterium sp.]|jgi:hypothetical protein|nr:hypothetical protein [Phenylobacterium sp.]HXA40931.1 hypothetical protein [Phenylobacterium sp.]